MMMTHFFKYQSLGNDFVVLDWYKRPATLLKTKFEDAGWTSFVQDTCNRHQGVGADCLLVIKNNLEHRIPEISVFNADGSPAQRCLNGLRCIAFHFSRVHRYPNEFVLLMGGEKIKVQVSSPEKTFTLVQTSVALGSIGDEKKLKVSQGDFTGHMINVGNPHFIIFENRDQKFLEAYGSEFESHSSFPEKTNVEFVERVNDLEYKLLVYERGCGITQACSSGVAALMTLLFHQNKLSQNQKISIQMPGGSVTSWIDKNNQVVLEAPACFVFSGELA